MHSDVKTKFYKNSSPHFCTNTQPIFKYKKRIGAHVSTLYSTIRRKSKRYGAQVSPCNILKKKKRMERRVFRSLKQISRGATNCHERIGERGHSFFPTQANTYIITARYWIMNGTLKELTKTKQK